jgi:cyclase
MTLKRVIARLDIKGDSLVKGLQLEGLRKIGDPLEFAQKYYLSGADEVVIVDVVASLYSRENLHNIISYITSNLRVPVTVVGGIRTIEDARRIFSSGADKVGINSAATRNISFLQDVIDCYGGQAVVNSIEAKYVDNFNDWYLFTESGRNNSGISLSSWLKSIAKFDIGEVLITSVDRDGMRKGPDLDLVKKTRSLTEAPLLYSGGISKESDITDLFDLDADGVVIGSAFHYGNLNIDDCKKYLLKSGVLVRKHQPV